MEAIVLLVIVGLAFGAGYGVRDLISRQRHRRKYKPR
jgi:hypothetical protein